MSEREWKDIAIEAGEVLAGMLACKNVIAQRGYADRAGRIAGEIEAKQKAEQTKKTAPRKKI